MDCPALYARDKVLKALFYETLKTIRQLTFVMGLEGGAATNVPLATV